MKIILIAILCALSFTAFAAAEAVYPDISHDDLVAAIKDKKVTLIDANGSKSFKEGHIPGAIDFEAAKDGLAAKLPKDKSALIVAYCGGPKCEAYQAAAKIAVDLGYTNVKHLSEGISGWKASGATVEKAGEDNKLGGSL